VLIWVVDLVPLLAAVILHEVARGYAAKSCGDATADKMGRLSMDPISHIGPVDPVRDGLIRARL